MYWALTQDKRCKYERHDDDESALQDLGRGPLLLVDVVELLVVARARSLDDAQGEDKDNGQRDVQSVDQVGVHGQEAVVLPAKVVVLEAHVEEDDDEGAAPADEHVLTAGQQAVLREKE